VTTAPEVIRPHWTVVPAVRVLSTTRRGGASTGPFASFNLGTHVGDDPAAVASNRAALRALVPDEPFWMEQVHGVEVVEADGLPAHVTPTADAAVTRMPRRVLCIMTADCLPVVLADVDGQVLAMAHAGWRGLAAGVLENTIERMRVGADRLAAWLGPAIGGNAYEVGEDVMHAFTGADPQAKQAFAPKGSGKYWCDLAQLARQRLARAGVGRIEGAGSCTFGDAGRFFSFRRDGRTGRMATCAWIDR